MDRPSGNVGDPIPTCDWACVMLWVGEVLDDYSEALEALVNEVPQTANMTQNAEPIARDAQLKTWHSRGIADSWHAT